MADLLKFGPIIIGSPRREKRHKFPFLVTYRKTIQRVEQDCINEYTFLRVLMFDGIHVMFARLVDPCEKGRKLEADEPKCWQVVVSLSRL